MNMTNPAPRATPAVPRDDVFELRFEDLYRPGRALSFPCDDHGRVDLDGLSERARSNYFYARAMIGREVACPAVVVAPSGAHAWH